MSSTFFLETAEIGLRDVEHAIPRSAEKPPGPGAPTHSASFCKAHDWQRPHPGYSQRLSCRPKIIDCRRDLTRATVQVLGRESPVSCVGLRCAPRVDYRVAEAPMRSSAVPARCGSAVGIGIGALHHHRYATSPRPQSSIYYSHVECAATAQ